MSEDSYIKMLAERVIELAKTRIAAIEADRTAAWLTRIDDEKKRRMRWRRFLPWLKPLSDDQAIKLINESIRWHPNMLGWSQQRRCVELVGLAKQADTVFLSCSDYYKIA